MGFDGTSKSNRANGLNIPYWSITSEALEKVKADVISSTSQEALSFLDPLNYQGPSILVDASTFVDDETGSSEDKWLAARRNYIGGSDCSALLGQNHYKTNLDLYMDKTGQNAEPKEETSDEDPNLITLWGHIAEEYVSAWYQTQYPNEKVLTDTNMYLMGSHPFIGGDMDGIIQMPDGHYKILEIKTTSFFNRDAWANGNIPVPYDIQVRQYMAILGLWEARIVCMVDRDTFYVRDIVRDLNKEYEIVKAADDFWLNHVMIRVPPEPIGPAEAVIKSLRKHKIGEKIDKSLPNVNLGAKLYTQCVEYDAVNTRYKQAKAEADRLDALRKEMTIPLIEAMGQAPDAYTVSGDQKTMFILKQKVRQSTSSDKKWAAQNLSEDVYNNIFHTKTSAPTLEIKKQECKGVPGMSPFNP